MEELAAKLLRSIASRVRACTLCPLCENRTNAVPGEGPPDARVFFIGEGPGAEEDAQGRPFVGRSGKLLEELLGHVGLAREDVFITSVVKCRPPNNRVPKPAEVAACAPYLEGQLEAIKPAVVCLLGSVAVRSVLGLRDAMRDLHGRSIERDGVSYVPLYHPAAAVRMRKLMPVLFADFEDLAALLGG